MITDTHFGCRGGSIEFYRAMRDFIHLQVVPYLKQNDISELYILGDFMDNRRSTDYRITTLVSEEILGYLDSEGIAVVMFCGNHDIFYRHSNEIVSYETFYEFDDMSSHLVTNKPYEYNNVLLMPWINQENYAECIDAIENTKCEYMMGHLEIDGAKMYANSVSEHGMSATLFKKFKRVFSGHFHHASTLANINYIGAAGYYNWQDFNDFRGMSIYDTDTDTVTQIANEHCMFMRLDYSEDVSLDIDMTGVKGKVVQLIVKDKNDINHFNSFVKLMRDHKPFDLKIIDESIKELSVDVSEDVEFEENVLTLFQRKFTEADKEDMIKLSEEIYTEATQL